MSVAAPSTSRKGEKSLVGCVGDWLAACSCNLAPHRGQAHRSLHEKQTMLSLDVPQDRPAGRGHECWELIPDRRMATRSGSFPIAPYTAGRRVLEGHVDPAGRSIPFGEGCGLTDLIGSYKDVAA